MIKLEEIFDIRYGHSLELNKLKVSQSEKGIAFVSRKSGDNGISAYVDKIEGLEPASAGELTCALSGNGVLSTFIQDREFYTGYHVAILTPKVEMSKSILLFYSVCLAKNKYKYSWGRQANRTLRDILVPTLDDIPSWVAKKNVAEYSFNESPVLDKNIELDFDSWKEFSYSELFDIARGRGPRKKDLDGTGDTPFITSSDSNNGLTNYTHEDPIHSSNTIGVNRNGSVAEAFYQPIPFCSTEDVHIFTPRFEMNKYAAMFLITLIKRERYRYSYGRKWGLERMRNSKMKLPVQVNGDPDWQFMESYIKSLRLSASI